jgi:methanogenic corrinoid protein MtbC1
MDEVWDDYWTALAAGDRHAALDVVRGLHEAGASVVEVIDQLVVPAQARIGELWLDGRWSVSQEHAATAINEGLVHWLGSFAPPPRPDSPLVVVSCIERERHALPALVVSESLGLAGYRVNYVGGDPEPSDLLRQVLVLKPRAVLFSASLTSSLGGQKSLFHSLHAIGIPVIVGGQAFGGDERRAAALGATAYARSVDEVLRLLEELPARVRPTTPPPPQEGDVEAAWIEEYRGEITPYVVRAVARRHLPDGEKPDWWPDFEGHLDHLVGCLTAALVTGDETIMIEVRDWLTQVLARRRAPEGLVEEIWSLLAEPLRGHPLARVFLAGSAAPASGSAPGRARAGGGVTDGLSEAPA